MFSHTLSIEALYTPEQIRAVEGGRAETSTPIINPGDVLNYVDANNKRCCICIKDHGMSTLQGEFFIIMNILDEDMDNDGYDREVTMEEMEQVLWCHI